MIDTIAIIGCIVSLLISTALPIGFIIYYGMRHKKQGVASAWLLGALGFAIPQLLVRIPILNAIAKAPGYMEFTVSHYVLYALALGVTAGLFEFAGRFAVAKRMEKKGRLNYPTALAAGLGHGGIEAIVLLGITYINNLVLMYLIQTGGFDNLVAQTAAAGADVSQLAAAKDLLLSTPSFLFFLGGLERLLAMTAHVGMSMVVCRTVYVKRAGLGAAICIGYHTLIDTACGLVNMLAAPQLGSRISQNTSYLIIYPMLTACAVLALYVVRRIRRDWNPVQEETHD